MLILLEAISERKMYEIRRTIVFSSGVWVRSGVGGNERKGDPHQEYHGVVGSLWKAVCFHCMFRVSFFAFIEAAYERQWQIANRVPVEKRQMFAEVRVAGKLSLIFSSLLAIEDVLYAIKSRISFLNLQKPLDFEKKKVCLCL